MAVGYPDWTELSAITGDVDITVETPLSVNFPTAQDVSITNANIDVAQSGSWTINAAQSGNWEVTFPSAQQVTFPSAQDVTVSSGSIEATFPSAQDIDIASATAKVYTFSTGDSVEQHKVSITDSSTTQSWTNSIRSFIFYNDGPNSCHVNFGGAATTDHFMIRARQTFAIDLNIQDTRFICATGESCTIYALGMYD